MKYAIEAWTIANKDDEEPAPTEMVDSKEFDTRQEAKEKAFDWLEAGYYVRLWHR
jgi:hypothetical protein